MVHMMSIQRAYSLEVWADDRIHAGYGWNAMIDDAINTSTIFMMLASPGFFASSYIFGTEIPAIRARRVSANALVIPVVVKRCYWQILAGVLQAVPTTNGHVKPIVDWFPADHGHDRAREQIAIAIGSYLGLSPSKSPGTGHDRSRTPFGRRQTSELIGLLSELRDVVQDLHDDLPRLNDELLRPQLAALVGTARTVLAHHDPAPRPTLPDDLGALLGAIRTIRIPSQDPDLGRTSTLDHFRQSKGLLATAVMDAQNAAAALGLSSTTPFVPDGEASNVERRSLEPLIQGISRRMADVRESLDTLQGNLSANEAFPQEAALAKVFTDDMRVEVGLAQLTWMSGPALSTFPVWFARLRVLPA